MDPQSLHVRRMVCYSGTGTDVDNRQVKVLSVIKAEGWVQELREGASSVLASERMGMLQPIPCSPVTSCKQVLITIYHGQGDLGLDCASALPCVISRACTRVSFN